MCSINARLPEQEPDWIKNGASKPFTTGQLTVFGWACVLIFVVSMTIFGPTSVSAQQSGGQKPTNLTVTVQIRPIAVPSTPTDIIRQDCYVCYADLAGTGQVITITDRQATPITWLANTLGTSGSRSTWFFLAPDNSTCRWMPNGITWGADTSGATGYMTVKCQSGPCTLVSGQ